ncbi:hypothetical protein Q0F99_07460 [Rathayibacter oskolensis]|uniref:hypothetical protein n=1 Tax=Rathayibacter oskolensis TaxID=1891671 RepID=UPI00265DB0A5|nr:hypothetical protein [Rathayibacter oskolensis]WKK72740.1 hypothetical protein Q0F99_07460 [Rathayibacter oskolensis]
MHPTDRSPTMAQLDRALSSADWDGVLSIIDRGWAELMQGSPRELLAVIDRLPGPVLTSRPRLRFVRDYLSRLLEGEDHPSTYRLITATTEPGDDLDRLALLTARIVAARAAGAGAEVERLIAAAHELRGGSRSRPLPSSRAPCPRCTTSGASLSSAPAISTGRCSTTSRATTGR